MVQTLISSSDFSFILQGSLLFILRMNVMLKMLFMDLIIFLLVMTSGDCPWSGLRCVIVLSELLISTVAGFEF